MAATRFSRIKQGMQVGFVYLFLYGLLFGYVTWTMYYNCGPSIFTCVFSGIVIIYTCYSTINFWGEKFILLWVILLLLSISSFVFGVLSAMDSCKLSQDNKVLYIDNGSKKYQWVYQIYFPDISLLPWIFILGFVSMRVFFIKWKLVRLFFVFLSYNAFFIGIGIFIIGYYILEQNEEYELIWQIAIVIIAIGSVPCLLFIIYTICCMKMSKKTKSNHSTTTSKSRTTNININYEYDDDDDIDDEEPFDPHQSFTIWVAIQMITSFLDLWSDILYVLLSDFYSPYLKIACWIFIFFQLIPDFFVLLQIISDPERYDNNNKVVWFPIRQKWSNNSNILERTIFVVLHSIFSILIFIVIGSILILLKIIPLIAIQNIIFNRNCLSIIHIPTKLKDEEDEDDDDDDEELIIIDLRMHLIFLLFEVFFESIPLVTIILINSYVLLDNMTGIAWISLAISGYVVLRNIYMFLDDICLSNKSQRKLYYCL